MVGVFLLGQGLGDVFADMGQLFGQNNAATSVAFSRTHSAWIRTQSALIQLVGQRRIEDARKAPKEGG